MSSLKRLASDHAHLHKHGLPANYIFPSDANADLTTLTVLLAGPEGTPFAEGLFRLTLNIANPASYPAEPPTATFRTKIFHPNVDQTSGAVCLDTLKRDWKPELKLYDILVTIRCLLVCPNPESALNAEAGKLMEEDWELFSKRASSFVRMYASVPGDIRDEVKEAKRRVVGDKVAAAKKQSPPKRVSPDISISDTVNRDGERNTPAKRLRTQAPEASRKLTRASSTGIEPESKSAPKSRPSNLQSSSNTLLNCAPFRKQGTDINKDAKKSTTAATKKSSRTPTKSIPANLAPKKRIAKPATSTTTCSPVPVAKSENTKQQDELCEDVEMEDDLEDSILGHRQNRKRPITKSAGLPLALAPNPLIPKKRPRPSKGINPPPIFAQPKRLRPSTADSASLEATNATSVIDAEPDIVKEHFRAPFPVSGTPWSPSTLFSPTSTTKGTVSRHVNPLAVATGDRKWRRPEKDPFVREYNTPWLDGLEDWMSERQHKHVP